MRLDARPVLVALLLAAVVPAFAAGPEWSVLTAEQQAVLAPAIKGGADEFNRLPEVRRQKLAEGARRWLEMSPDQRIEANRQFDTWQRMSPGERQAALERRERFRSLPRGEQQSLLRERTYFQALPLDEQQRLREAFRSQLELRSVDPLNVPAVDSLLPPTLPTVPVLPPPSTTPSPTPSLLPQ